jgi:hypothetical protein
VEGVALESNLVPIELVQGKKEVKVLVKIS